MRLGPFGRAEEAGFLAVPARVDQGPPRFPAGPGQRTDRLRLGHDRDVAREGIPGPEDPSVVVVSADDPLVGKLGPLHHRDHVVDRLQAPVGGDRQVHLGRPGAYVVGEGQRAAPARGGDLPVQRREEGPRVRAGDRDHRNLEDGRGVLDLEALRVLGGAYAGGQRIAGVQRDVRDGTALNAVVRAITPLGIDVARPVAVLVGVGIDDAPGGAVLLRKLGLEPAPAAAVAHDHDLSLDVQGAPLELGVVGRHPEIDIDEVRRHVPVRAIDVVGGEGTGGVARRPVAGDLGLIQPGLEVHGGHKLERDALGRRVQDIECLDPRVPSPLLELPEHEIRIRLVMRRTHLVRLRGHPLQPYPQLSRVERRVEVLFALLLGRRGRGPEAQEPALRGNCCRA